MKVPGAILVRTIALAAVSGCGLPERAEVDQRRPPRVTVERPVRADVEEFVELAGRTAAVQTVEVRARVEGVLTSVTKSTEGESRDFVEGSRVKEGDLLFVLEQAPVVARLKGAQAAKSRAEAQAELARRNYEFSQKLVASLRAAAESRTMTAELSAALVAQQTAWATQQAAAAALKQAEADIAAAQLDLGHTEIRAPIAGVVGRRHVDFGNLVGVGEKTLLTTVADVGTIHVHLDVDQRVLLALRRGRGGAALGPAVELAMPDEEDFSHQGDIDFVAASVEPATGVARVRARFPNPDGVLLPGLVVRVRVPLGTHEDAVLVHERGIGTDPGGRYVLVVSEDSVVEQRYVELGMRHKGMQIVRNRFDPHRGTGLNPDELYVVGGLSRARPGQIVDTGPERAEERDQEAAPDAAPEETPGESPPPEAAAAEDD
jgi:RND family efflux transporter MFP subunit